MNLKSREQGKQLEEEEEEGAGEEGEDGWMDGPCK